MHLVLASASPRRRELLVAAGFTVDVVVPNVDESIRENERPEALVERLARSKAESVAIRRPRDVVVAGDTVVVLDDEILGKPRGASDAARMLRELSGRSHDVLTGVAIATPAGLRSAVDRSTVWMVSLADPEIAWYVSTGEPLGKAGAYAIQGAGSRLIARIDGSYSNVVGLPIAALVRLLKEAGCRILQ